ncbi:MAG: hypothetical protein ACXVFQ_06040 [Solirubrobacteraceae bacterium]
MNVAALADDTPTRQFVGASVGDRCAACGTPLATDQKYCLNCGERRGKARFPLGASTAAAAAAAPPAASRPPKKQRLSSSTALVAGVGTLLLAMGVGVLIGRTDNGSSKNANAPAQIITVGGSSGATSGAAAATTQGEAKAAKGKASKKAKATASKPTVNKQQAAKAQAAASKVLGSSKNLPPPTVTQGQSGHGAGYTKGHFTGTFFGQ